ncbi:GTPase HflX [Elusimicrobiota bacterium]
MWDVETNKSERAVLIGVQTPNSKISIEESLSELYQLSRTAGARVIGKFAQKREKPHPTYYFGKGKIIELKDFILANDINLVVVDDELLTNQESTLEEELGCKVIDRTRLILDIFAIHASSSVGKLQVELAQMEYSLPRLQNLWAKFSRLGGGIGTRGPGEKKIEMDKRIINDRISSIRKKLQCISQQRKNQRKQRKKSLKKTICLVGYTNSGKSTLLNTLTGSKVIVANKLFATLSPTTRRLNCGKHDVLISDTVGFIRKLPHHVVEAFMATLEQVQEADLLVHVIDISSENFLHQIDAVENVLSELECMDIPIIKVFNKTDMVQLDISDKNESVIYVSALKRTGIDSLLKSIEEKLDDDIDQIRLKIPQSRHDVVSSVYSNFQVCNKSYEDDYIVLSCYLKKELIDLYREFIIEC